MRLKTGRKQIDYEFAEFEKLEVEEYLSLAKEFLEETKKYLGIKS